MKTQDALSMSNALGTACRALVADASNRQMLIDRAYECWGEVEPTARWSDDQMKVYQDGVSFLLHVMTIVRKDKNVTS